jgi:hypothetical protein
LPVSAHTRPETDTFEKGELMNTLQFIAWIFVHIAISIFAPIALLPFLAIGRSEPSRLMVISTLFTTASAVLFGFAHYLIDFS